ncbi:glycosyltransferase [Chryseobacterium sp.]|uniref:glycosyltransferase n=1 Tax=Chryseobacterium sp. TaxID=1871047 RepID=UPI0011CC2204|nr:glycosyltransferase [Chryseobacterium sp.]TXF76168.1 glycosyltransferase family 4 protein [Chryseobacterium sp.]
MRKKILFISSWFPNKLEPTNGNFVQRHAEAVSKLQDVEILHAMGDFNQQEIYLFDDQSINDIRTLIVYYKNTGNPILNFFRRMNAYKKGFSKMQRPELVHANVLHNSMLFAVYLKKRYKIPFVITEHWTSLQTENHPKTSAIIKKTAAFIANQASYVLPVSENLKSGLKKLGIISPMKVISNVVDTEVFTIANKERESEINFLHLSSLIPRKKPDKIIETVIKLHENGYAVKLEIGGDGDTETLRKLVHRRKADHYINVFDAISYQEVAEKMQQSDCFILFSENETQGCVILESYACGKPVIATNVGGVPEFVKPGFGILIEKNNESELYTSMESFIKDQAMFQNPTNLRDFVLENFSKQSIGKAFTAVYDEVLKNPVNQNLS